MAKRKHHPEQIGAHTRQVDIKSFLANSSDKRSEIALYANHAQLAVTANDMIMDLYILGPTPGYPDRPEATLVQRVVIPHALAKGLATALANLVAAYERGTGNILPLNRTPDADDTIEIWEQKADDRDSQQLDNV